MNWIKFLTRSKGVTDLFRRGKAILNRYGLTTNQMSAALHLLDDVLTTYECKGSFLITARALERHPEVILPLQERMEFAIHGYVHVDYSQLSLKAQDEHLGQALSIFTENKIPCVGFRPPYLHWNTDTLIAIKKHGLLYESNQPVLWDVLNGQTIDLAAKAAYKRVIDFYEAKDASQYLSLPRLNDLVSIPVALPDDEMLIERLRFNDQKKIERAWRFVLEQTYQRDELFTLSLHPERTRECHLALSNVLADARARQPSVWIVQLRELADWWQHRHTTQIQIVKESEEKYHLYLEGPEGLTVLARGVQVDAPSKPWFGEYSQIFASEFVVQCATIPFIGVAPTASPDLMAFLKEMGYLIEISDVSTTYNIYLDQVTFSETDEKPLIERIENSGVPLVRLGLWPKGARSALAITGDIDALTLWDFGLRILGS